MVDCLTDLGTRTGIPVFYIGFLLAPLASNASELFSVSHRLQLQPLWMLPAAAVS